jgi:hypothetical protein
MKNFIFIIALYLHVGLPLNAAVKGKEGRILVRMPYQGDEDVEDVEDAKDEKTGGFLSLIAVQAGSTIEIDNLKIVDLSTGRIFYQNNFNSGDLTGLQLQHSHDQGKNRIVNGRLRLECIGFGQNGRGAYESFARMHLQDDLPKDFELSFVVKKLQWPGHFEFMIYSDSSQRHIPIALKGLSFYTSINGSKINHVTTWDQPANPKPHGSQPTKKVLYGPIRGWSGPYQGRDVRYKLRMNKGKLILWVQGRKLASN